MTLFKRLLEEQEAIYHQIDVDSKDLQDSISHFKQELEEVSKADRVYSQENIKKRLEAERELSEVTSLKKELNIERSNLLNINSKKLSNELSQRAVSQAYSSFKLANDDVFKEEVKSLLMNLRNLLDGQEEEYNNFIETMLRELDKFYPYLKSEYFSSAETSIRYKNNHFKREILDMINKDIGSSL